MPPSPRNSPRQFFTVKRPVKGRFLVQGILSAHFYEQSWRQGGHSTPHRLELFQIFREYVGLRARKTHKRQPSDSQSYQTAQTAILRWRWPVDKVDWKWPLEEDLPWWIHERKLSTRRIWDIIHRRRKELSRQTIPNNTQPDHRIRPKSLQSIPRQISHLQ